MSINYKTFAMKPVAMLIGVAGLFSVAGAQDKEPGEIESIEYKIVKSRENTVSKANRNFEKIPPRAAEPIRPEMTYEVRNLSFTSRDYTPAIRPLKLEPEAPQKLYGNYVAAGLGNYSAPYGELFLNNKRDKEKFYGLHFYHYSFGKGAVDGKNSASGNTKIDLFGKYFTPKVTTGAYINYEKNTGYFYGYKKGEVVNRDQINQDYNVTSLGGEIENTKPADFNFKLNGGFSYLTDRYSAKESEVQLAWKNDYKLSETTGLGLNVGYVLVSRKDVLIDAQPRHLIKAGPSYQFIPLEKLNLSIGFNAAYENDAIDDKSFHVYPNIWADYELGEAVKAYAGLTGDMDKVSLHTLSRENFWVNSNIKIYHTNRTADFTAGLKGKLVQKLAFNAGFSFANLKNLYFYQNAAAATSKFDVTYDRGNTTRINLFADLGLSVTEKARFNLRGDYFGYSTDEVPEAWHRPTYRMAFNSTFNVYNKLLLNADFVAQGGMKALNVTNNTVVTLDPALDLNFKATYNVSKQVSVFLKLNNILASDYQLYMNYPVRGFQGMGGVSWSF